MTAIELLEEKLAQVTAELEELKATGSKAYAERMAEEHRVLAMNMEANGSFRIDMQWAKNVLIALTAASRTMTGDAKNYVEMGIVDRGAGCEYLHTIRKRDGKSPHELRMEAVSTIKDFLLFVTAKMESDLVLRGVINRLRAVVDAVPPQISRGEGS